MILKEHPSHDYVEKSVADLIPFGRNVVTQMTTNAITFGPLDDPLINVTNAVNDLEIKHNAFLANPSLAAAMETSRKVVIKVVNKQNKTVDRVADGAGGVIDQSGFNKTKAFSSPLDRPAKPVVSDHHPVAKGHYYIQCKPQAGNNFLYLIVPVGAVVTKNGNQISIDKAPINEDSDMHPVGDMNNLPSGDQHLYVLSSNRAGMSDLPSPILISVP